ncbi:MAG: phage integrase N-terminal SAM-like domain-containing protein [Deltaproteobacteria bacterium]|nr:phage integrase N-terminal SAM-like domain-containing protein [Deltaproteobacteria bacterium]
MITNKTSVRDVIRLKHYSVRTECAYISWIKRFIFFHDKKHLDTKPFPISHTIT